MSKTLCYWSCGLLVPALTLAQTKDDASEPATKALEFELSGILRARDLEARPTAEELLRALRSSRPSNPTIPPASSLGQPAKVETQLWPEGTALVGRSGWLKEIGPSWVFVFDPAEGDPPIKLLPNTELEIMVRTATAASEPIRFIVSGETTVFSGENYLLVRVVRRDTREDDPDTVGDVPNNPSAVINHDSSPTDAAPQRTANRDGPPDASALDVLSAMRRQKPRESVIPMQPVPPRRKLRGAPPPLNVKPEGSPLTSRAGRVLREGDFWVLALESSHPDQPEPPLKLLPNHTVEQMVVASQGGERGVVFLVSGEITLFDGENYLLPAMALRRVDADNLHP